jgi:hypothetical protein
MRTKQKTAIRLLISIGTNSQEVKEIRHRAEVGITVRMGRTSCTAVGIRGFLTPRGCQCGY